MSRPVATIAFTALLVLASSSLSAQERDLAKARQQNARGQELYEKGNYRAAVIEFEQALALSGAPGLHFQIGQAKRGGGDCAGALSAYRQYLEKVPDAPNRGLVEQLIETMQKCVSRQEAARARERKSRGGAEGGVAFEQRPPRRQLAWKIGGLSAAAVGAVVLGFGIKAGLDARRYQRTVDDHVSGQAWTDEELDALDEGPKTESRAIALNAIGGLALLGGASVALYGFFTADEGGTVVVPTAGNDSVGAALWLRF